MILKVFHIGIESLKRVRYVDHDEGNTVAKACELIRDMLAGRSYQVPNYVADEAKDH